MNNQEKIPLILGTLNHSFPLVMMAAVCVMEPGECNGGSIALSYLIVFGLVQIPIELLLLLWILILWLKGVPSNANSGFKVLYLFTLALLPAALFI